MERIINSSDLKMGQLISFKINDVKHCGFIISLSQKGDAEEFKKIEKELEVKEEKEEIINNGNADATTNVF